MAQIFWPKGQPNLLFRNLSFVRGCSARLLTSAAPAAPNAREAWLFVDSVFPVRLGSWDFRHYISAIREEALLGRLQTILSSIKTHDFTVLSLQPHHKDGGVFVKFSYSADQNVEEALASIELGAKEEVAKGGGVPSWIGLRKGDVWLVRGTPWREDLNRFASPILKVSFDGPDIEEESIYTLFRPYGQIYDIALPTPVPAGTLRSSNITFRRLRSATIARNAGYGLQASASTRLKAAYEQPLKANAIRNWLSGHPKIVLPVIVFLLGTLTYTIFDPIRSFMVQGKMEDWFDYREFRVWKWIRAQTVDWLSTASKVSGPGHDHAEVWKERKEAEISLRNYLSELPTTVAFVHGPQGSGKSRMLSAILDDTSRKSLVIDCSELNRATTDVDLVTALARQTGYWPVFSFLNSINNLIDLASVGLIGQKTGLSSTIEDQLKQVLEVVGDALKSVSSEHRKTIKRKIRQSEVSDLKKLEEDRRRERIRNGTWHDGRLDCVAGNGIMSELGFGDERLNDYDTVALDAEAEKVSEEREKERERERRRLEEVEAIASLPIVVIKNYGARVGGNRKDFLDVLSTWAASLVENQLAHIVVVSDNRENSKRFAKALPSKPLFSVALSDADAASALSFVKDKLGDAAVQLEFHDAQIASLQKLGGRAIDLESLIRKVVNGQNVEEAVEDIINRGVGEVKKNAFGDDADDAKNLLWSREHVWAVLKLLSKHGEVAYHDVLLDFPFKGDETPLREMERAELISITTLNGRPSTIRPGKPMYQCVFERLVEDRVFQATQDISFNERAIASAEKTIQACEQELVTLKETGSIARNWWGARSASSMRAKYLLNKMVVAETKIEGLEKRNVELRRVLATEI